MQQSKVDIAQLKRAQLIKEHITRNEQMTKIKLYSLFHQEGSSAIDFHSGTVH